MISVVDNFPRGSIANGAVEVDSLYNVTFYPESGLTVTFYGAPVSVIDEGQIAMPSQTFVADGGSDDYLTLGSKRNRIKNVRYTQQIDAQNYLNGLQPILPKVSTDGVNNVSTNSADIYGILSLDGAYPTIERGFVWKLDNENGLPTVLNNKVIVVFILIVLFL